LTHKTKKIYKLLAGAACSVTLPCSTHLNGVCTPVDD
jgi:hypothetical protein